MSHEETSETTDMFEIDRLLATQKQNEEAIVKMRELLQARLHLLDEAILETVDGRRQPAVEQENTALRTKNGELAKEISTLLAENLALQEAAEKKTDRISIGWIVFYVFLGVLCWEIGGATCQWMFPTQYPTVTVQPEIETLESFVSRESQVLTADERQKLIAVSETILSVPFDTPSEMREAFRYERRKAGIDSPAFDVFVEKWAEKVESMNIEENVEAVRQVYESLLSGLRSYNDIPGEPVEGFFHNVSPSIINDTFATDVDEPVSPDIVQTEKTVIQQRILRRR